MIMISRISILLFTISLLALACVENTISIRIHPDGQSYFKFHSYGDSLDIFNDDFIHPSGSMILTSSRGLGEDDNWIHTTEVILNDSVHIFTYDEDPSLGYKYNTRVSTSFFKTEYEFRLTFSGRMIKLEYPRLYSAMTSEELDSLYWAPETFTILMKKGLDDLSSKLLIENDLIFNDRLVNHIRNSFERIEDREILNRIKKNKATLLSELLQPFKVNDSLPIILAQAMQPHEDRLRKTIDLHDDTFIIKLLMPGQPHYTNANDIRKDTLIWNFGIDSLLHTDHNLMAKSVIYDFAPLQKLVIFISIILFLFMFFLMRRGLLW